jgi:hypothetical protein
MMIMQEMLHMPPQRRTVFLVCQRKLHERAKVRVEIANVKPAFFTAQEHAADLAAVSND